MFIEKIRLNLFEGAASAGAGEGSGDGAVAQGANDNLGNTRRGKTGEFENVKFGKQSNTAEGEVTNAADTSAAGKATSEVKVTSNTLEDKRKAFQDLVQGEYKDQYTEATQRIIDRRFGETKQLQSQISSMLPLISSLAERYGLKETDLAGISKAVDNDASFLAEMAEEAGMTVEQYKQLSKLKKENEAFKQERLNAQNKQAASAQVQKWVSEAEAVKTKFPGFDLQVETQNPQFMGMLKSGVPVEHAYKVVHFDEIMTDAMQTTATKTEAAVVNNVRARGTRPQENGTAAQSAFTVKDDVSKLNRKERAEIAKRVARGEQITF